MAPIYYPAQDVAVAFSNILEFGDQAFTTIVLVLAAGIGSSIAFGYGTRKGRECFLALILSLLVGVQLYHLIFAAMYIPASRFQIMNPALHRSDCLASTKGGKRPFPSTIHYDINPCFCFSGATCQTKLTHQNVTKSSCPLDESAECRMPDGGYIEMYLSYLRDCKGGQGPACTKQEPCTPCERSRLVEFGVSAGLGRCRTCSTDFKGDCNFVPDVGPYCFKKHGSKEIEPCKQCCTEPERILVNGVCY